MSPKVKASRETVISFLKEKSFISYQESLAIVEELEKYQLIQFDKDEYVSVKELAPVSPKASEKYYYMPKVLVKSPEYKKMSAEAKFGYTRLSDAINNEGGFQWHLKRSNHDK